MVMLLFLPVMGKKKGKFIIPGITVPSTFRYVKDPFDFANGVRRKKGKKSKIPVYVGYR